VTSLVKLGRAVDGGPDTTKGALIQQKGLICMAEKAVGDSINYTVAGTLYESIKAIPDEDCFASGLENMLQEMPEGGYEVNLTAYAIENSDWQKKLVFELPAMGMEYQLFFTIEASRIAFKAVENWTQAERIESGDYDKMIAADAEGLRGGTISVDLAAGTLTAETINTYWGGRIRLVATGTINPTTLAFDEITALEGISSRAYIFSNIGPSDPERALSINVATVAGNVTDGFKYGQSLGSCVRETRTYGTAEAAACPVASIGTDAIFFEQLKTECYPSTADCSAVTLPDFTEYNTATHEFIAVSPAFDALGGKRADIEAAFDELGIPCFKTVSKSVVVPSTCD
jgi:hypothetical protein